LFLVTLLILGSGSISDARIEGVDYAELEVGGQVYDCPIGNKERRSDMYFIKKAIKGDMEALEVILGISMTDDGNFTYYCGDDTGHRWLTITPDGQASMEVL